jgi:hypothetical protein
VGFIHPSITPVPVTRCDIARALDLQFASLGANAQVP